MKKVIIYPKDTADKMMLRFGDNPNDLNSIHKQYRIMNMAIKITMDIVPTNIINPILFFSDLIFNTKDIKVFSI